MPAMDIFVLTDTPFFEKLRQQLKDEDLHVEGREFLLMVHEITKPSSAVKTFALDALIIADIEFRHIKSTQELHAANRALADMVDKAHRYVLHKIEECKASGVTFVEVPDESKIESISVDWNRTKSEFSLLCYVLKLAQSFAPKTTQAAIVKSLSSAFNADVSPEYAKKIIYEAKMSPTIDKAGIRFLKQLVGAGQYLLDLDTAYDPNDPDSFLEETAPTV